MISLVFFGRLRITPFFVLGDAQKHLNIWVVTEFGTSFYIMAVSLEESKPQSGGIWTNMCAWSFQFQLTNEVTK